MAILHRAEITPTKLEAVAMLLDGRPWAGSGDPVAVGRGYRFDDPAGEVGVETLLVRRGDGPVLHVPLTYRGSPLGEPGAVLVTEMDHSVLGRRWVYDGCTDPVGVACLATAVLAGGCQADQHVETDDGPVRREPDTLVSGSGSGADVVDPAPVVAEEDDVVTRVRTVGVELVVRRVLDDAALAVPGGADVLTGTWPGSPEPTVLAAAWRTSS